MKFMRFHGTTPSAVEFFLPEPPRLLRLVHSPHAEEIERASARWIRASLRPVFRNDAAMEHWLGDLNGLFGPMTLPMAPDDRARNVADFWQLATLIDDDFVSRRIGLGIGAEDARALVVRLRGILRGEPAHTGSAYEAALADVWGRLAAGLSPSQAARFLTGVDEFLTGCLTEIPVRVAGRTLDYDEYLRVRRDSFASSLLLLFAEYATGVDMTAQLPRDPAFGALHDAVIVQMIFVNDMLSFRKEWRQTDGLNVISVLCEDGLGLQEAVDRTAGWTERAERTFLQIAEGIDRRANGEHHDDVRRYLDALEYQMSGAREFQYRTPRYHGDGYVWDGTRSGMLGLFDEHTVYRSARP